MGSWEDLAGRRFGGLVAVRYVRCAWRSPNGRAYPKWECQCDCGRAAMVAAPKLKNGNTASCGCLQSEARATNHLIHGMSGTPEMWSWQHMIRRCGDPDGPEWKNYGGRGIVVCDEWRISFQAFISHIGQKPSPKHSIERIENDGNYEPGNVRWATPAEQRANQRPRDHCMRGHPFSPENTLYRRGRQQRECRVCMRARVKAKRGLKHAS